ATTIPGRFAFTRRGCVMRLLVPCVLSLLWSVPPAYGGPAAGRVAEPLEGLEGKVVVFDHLWLGATLMRRDKANDRFELMVRDGGPGYGYPQGLVFTASVELGNKLAGVSLLDVAADGDRYLVRLTCKIV